jgi:hypothetical protein
MNSQFDAISRPPQISENPLSSRKCNDINCKWKRAVFDASADTSHYKNKLWDRKKNQTKFSRTWIAE